jgi:hypothetical protein
LQRAFYRPQKASSPSPRTTGHQPQKHPAAHARSCSALVSA